MVRVIASDLPPDSKDLLGFLSEDSDNDDPELITQKISQIEPLEKLDTSFPDTIVVLGIPEVHSDKIVRLQDAIRKRLDAAILTKSDTIPQYKIDIPVTEEGNSFGFAFFTFESAFDTQNYSKLINGMSLDAKHQFKVTPMDKVEEIANRSEEYKAPDRLPGYTRENFRWWMFDDRAREQFVLRYQDKTEIYWNDPIEHEPVLAYNGHREGTIRWTELLVQWSPQGSYLATFHSPGIALWAGENFEKKVRFRHERVEYIDFSPNEEYLLTWSGTPPVDLSSDRSVRIWKVMTGEWLASFATPLSSPRGGENKFPLFLWNHDSKYISRMGEDGIYVHKLPSMELVTDANKKQSPFKYPSTLFDWSPVENILSICWIKKSKSEASQMFLIEVPSRKELICKNVYDVERGSMHWQSKGDLLALNTYLKKRLDGKKKMKNYTQLEIFRMREKNIPVDIIQIDDSEVKEFHWEGGFNCRRFALIVVEDVTKDTSICFYRVSDLSGYNDTVFVERFDLSSSAVSFHWSPMGSNFVFGIVNDSIIQFCTLNDNERVEVIHKDEHLTMRGISWSSCGRYVTTSSYVDITNRDLSPNTGFCIWSFQGKLLYKSTKETFYQFLWRPHPQMMISDKKVDEIKKNLKEYSRKFDSIDEKLRLAQRDAFLSIRRKEVDDFIGVLEYLETWRVNHPLFDEWEEAWKNFYSNFVWDEQVNTREEILEIREEKVSSS